jgi:dienelactone hydrolase
MPERLKPDRIMLGPVRLPVLALSVLICSSASAKIVTEKVEYRHGETILEGVLVHDDVRKGKRPGVLVIHEWMGINDHTLKAARDLAGLGYVAFAADIYGKGVRPADPKAAGAESGKYKADRQLLRARAGAGLDVLRGHKLVDASRLGAIGFCFGGTAVLELARSGAPVRGVVSFHGGLDAPTPADGKNIQGKVLALHGADDPYVPQADLQAFIKELREAGVDWQLVEYGGAVHSFTNPKAGDDPKQGAAYNEKVARRAWTAMRAFFDEVLRE